jgi:hypothetical protein
MKNDIIGKVSYRNTVTQKLHIILIWPQLKINHCNPVQGQNRARTGPEQGFPCVVILTGKNMFSLQGTPLLIAQRSEGPLYYIFKKYFFKKGFYRLKLARELKFYTWIIIQGSKSLRKGQKMLKKAKKLV